MDNSYRVRAYDNGGGLAQTHKDAACQFTMGEWDITVFETRSTWRTYRVVDLVTNTIITSENETLDKSVTRYRMTMSRPSLTGSSDREVYRSVHRSDTQSKPGSWEKMTANGAWRQCNPEKIQTALDAAWSLFQTPEMQKAMREQTMLQIAAEIDELEIIVDRLRAFEQELQREYSEIGKTRTAGDDQSPA